MSWANGSHDTAGYAEPHDRKQAQHRSEAYRYPLQEIEHKARYPHPSSMKRIAALGEVTMVLSDCHDVGPIEVIQSRKI